VSPRYFRGGFLAALQKQSIIAAPLTAFVKSTRPTTFGESDMVEQKEIDALRREIRALRRLAPEVTPEQEAEQARLDEQERIASWLKIDRQRLERSASSATSILHSHIEQQRLAAERWLDLCGCPPDADGELKTALLGLRDGHAQQIFSDLVAAIAGKETDDTPSTRKICAHWPNLSPAVRSSFARVADWYGKTSEQAV
jgi:hypothetical protein